MTRTSILRSAPFGLGAVAAISLIGGLVLTAQTNASSNTTDPPTTEQPTDSATSPEATPTDCPTAQDASAEVPSFIINGSDGTITVVDVEPDSAWLSATVTNDNNTAISNSPAVDATTDESDQAPADTAAPIQDLNEQTIETASDGSTAPEPAQLIESADVVEMRLEATCD